MMKIVFTSGSCVGAQYLFDLSAPILIGRHPSAAVRLSDYDISPRHVEIGVDADGIYVICLNRYGFRLNGRFIAHGERHVFRVGDEVSIGASTSFRVECLDVNVPKFANQFECSPIGAGENLEGDRMNIAGEAENVIVDKSLDDDSVGWLDETEGDEDKVPVAVKSDWKTFDMPQRLATFFLRRPISPAQMRILRRGHVPKEMEDKWFWYMQGDTLFAHRSWTGYCIYRIDFSMVNYHKVTVNRDVEQYKCTSVEEDRETLNRLLDWWTCSPYDHYGEWLSETATALKKDSLAKVGQSNGSGGSEEVGRLDVAIVKPPLIAAGSKARQHRDRCKGMLWGLIVGDCFGSPIQFSGKDDHPWITEMVECPVFGLPPGYWTDDSSMAMCVMDSYMRKNGYDLHDIGNTFAKWFSEGYLSSVEGRAFDIGGATHAACRGIALGHEYVNGQESSQGNGSIMRFAPSYLIAQKERDPAKVMHEVSDLTHSATKVREVVDRFAKILDEHVAGRRTAEVSPYKSREEVNNSGWAVSTLDAALWAFNTTNTFEDGLVAAVNLGGDSDSIGAVYGQMAGAYYGFSAIPERWIREVKTWESVDSMIEDFLDHLAIQGTPLPGEAHIKRQNAGGFLEIFPIRS